MSFIVFLIFVSSLLAAPPRVIGLETSSATTAESIVLGNSTGVVVTEIELVKLRRGNAVVTELTVLNCLVGGDDGDCTDTGDIFGEDLAITSVTISYVNSTGVTETQTAYLTTGEANFTGLDLNIPHGSTVEAQLAVETTAVDHVSAASGDQFALVVKAFTTSDFAATADRGLTLTGRNVRRAAEGEIMTIAKTEPTISLSSGSPSGAGIPGWGEVVRFNIAADARGYVAVEELLFAIESTDNAGSGWNSLAGLGQDANWAVYDTADMSTQIDTGVDFYGTTELEYILVYLEDEIAAGLTNTYVIYADTTGASAANDDTIRIDIPEESEADLLGLDTIVWIDDCTSVYYDGSLVHSLPIYGNTISY